MSPKRKTFGHIMAKPLGIDLDHQQEPNYNHEIFADSMVEPFWESSPTLKEYLANLTPTKAGAVVYIRSLFPFWEWIFHYNLQWLIGDVIAGLTVGFVVIPQGMAYAFLARLTPEYGLYTSFVGFLLYWAFATSKDITIGTVAIMSTIVGNVVDKVQDQHPDIPAEQIARGLSLVSGGILLFIGLIRFGWLVEFIPLVAIASFTTGAALSIAAGQVPGMMGIQSVSTRGPTYKIVINTLKNLGQTRIDAAMGISAMVMLYFIRWLCNFLAKRQPRRKKIWFFVSTLRMAFVFLLYVMISWLVNMNIERAEDANFEILGDVPRGFRHAGVPHLDARLISSFSSDLPATLIVLLIEHIAISKSFGRINNYTIDPSQELVALGFTNLFGPFLGGYPATGSFSRTAIKSKAGVRTPLAGIFTAILVLLALYALTSVFFYIPMASLSGLIIHAVLDVVTPPDAVYQFWRVSPIEVFIFFAGVLVTVFSNIENGIYTAIAAFAALLLFRHARAKGTFIGRLHIQYVTASQLPHYTPDSSTNTTTDTSSNPDGIQHRYTETSLQYPTSLAYIPFSPAISGTNPLTPPHSPYPGIFIYKFTDGLTYVNQAHHLSTLLSTLLTHTRPTRPHHYTRAGDRPWNDPGPAPQFLTRRRRRRRRLAAADVEAASGGERERGEEGRQTADSDDADDARPPLRAIVLDFAAVPHVDVTAVQGLADARARLDRHAAPQRVEWHFAGAGARWVRRALVAGGFGGPLPPAAAGGEGDGGGGRARAEVVGRGSEAVSGVAEVADAAGDGGTGEAAGGAAAADLEKGGAGARRESEKGALSVAGRKRMAAVCGVNRPFFHVDVATAVRCAVLIVERKERSESAV